MRELTAWALYEIEDPATAPALQAALRTETNKELQLKYIRALAAMGEQSVDAIRPSARVVRSAGEVDGGATRWPAVTPPVRGRIPGRSRAPIPDR